MFGPPDRRADLSSLRLWGNEPPHGGLNHRFSLRRGLTVAWHQDSSPFGRREWWWRWHSGKAVTGTVRLPRQADWAGMTFNSLRTLSWPNVGNSLEAPLRISGLRDAVRRTRRSRDGFGTAGPTLRHSSRSVLWPPSDCRECSMRFPRVERLLITSVENLGLGGQRVLVLRQWSGKTLGRHRADRATVVRQALAEAGIVALESERLAADVVSADGKPRSCGPTPGLTRRSTPGSSSPLSPSDNSGKPSIKPPMLFKVPCRLWMVFRQPISHPDQPVPTTLLGLPDHQPSLGLRPGGSG